MVVPKKTDIKAAASAHKSAQSLILSCLLVMSVPVSGSRSAESGYKTSLLEGKSFREIELFLRSGTVQLSPEDDWPRLVNIRLGRSAQPSRYGSALASFRSQYPQYPVSDPSAESESESGCGSEQKPDAPLISVLLARQYHILEEPVLFNPLIELLCENCKSSNSVFSICCDILEMPD